MRYDGTVSPILSVTGSMDLIERLNSEIDKEKEEATAEAIALVLKSSL